VSGTQARAEAFHEVMDTQDFRAGICYATANQYPRIIPTVDVVILRGNTILLGKKPGERAWRFIGGYAEKNESYERTAKREAAEEAGTNMVHDNQIEYIGSSFIDDWRYKGSPDQIKTSLFVMHYPCGPTIAGDDIAEVKWFKIPEGVGDGPWDINIMPEHVCLMKMFLHWWSTEFLGKAKTAHVEPDIRL
jgi:NADH pyrophosphatase NudC (nudix superfamily)